jgi:hypothetical protein
LSFADNDQTLTGRLRLLLLDVTGIILGRVVSCCESLMPWWGKFQPCVTEVVIFRIPKSLFL